MNIEGLEFMEWLHKIREESEKERKKKKISGDKWLKEIKKEAGEIMEKLSQKRTKVIQ